MRPRAGRWRSARPGSKWRHGDSSPRHARRAQLKVEIARLFAQHRGTYGSPRITGDLRAAGWRVSENTVAALMRELGLQAQPKPRRRQTTRQGRGRWRAPDLINRDSPASTVNRKSGYRDPHRDGQALPGLGVGHGVAPHRRVRRRRAPRRRPGPGRVADGGRSPRGQGRHRRGDSAYRPRQRAHREKLPGRLWSGRHQAVHGQGGLGGGQRGHRELALDVGVRAAPTRALHHQGPSPGPSGRVDRGVQPRSPSLLARDAAPVAYELRLAQQRGDE